MENTPTPGEEQGGLDRRTVLRRGAILGGALVWTVPAVQTLAGPAFAVGTNCVPDNVTSVDGVCVSRVVYTDPPGQPAGTCCKCYTSIVAAVTGAPDVPAGTEAPVATVLCQVIFGKCTATPAPCPA